MTILSIFLIFVDILYTGRTLLRYHARGVASGLVGLHNNTRTIEYVFLLLSLTILGIEFLLGHWVNYYVMELYVKCITIKLQITTLSWCFKVGSSFSL